MEYKLKYKHLRLLVRIKNNFISREIISFIKKTYENTLHTNSQLKTQFLQFLPFFIASTFTGVAAFIYYRLFNYTEKLSVFLFEKNNLFIFILTPVFFLLSWWLVRRYSPYARGSGIPQIMAGIELSKPDSRYLIRQLLGVRIIIIKVLSSIANVMGGGVVGREGPTIQIAGSIFAVTYRLLPSSWPPISRRNFLVAGAASGLAAAFNTPLGGIVFAMEELSKHHFKYYKSPLFVAVIIAGLVAQGLSGPYLYLGYPKLNTQGFEVYLGVVIVALIAGYFGSKMSQIILRIIKFVNSFKNESKQILIVLLSALIVSSSIYIFGTDVMGSGKELMEKLLFTGNKQLSWYIPFVRMNGLIASFSFGGAGGIFAPSLSSGASIGAVVSELLHLTGSNANLLILIGMTAFLTGVTRAPFTSAIIVFEMTDRHSVIFFLMLGAILANLISNNVSKHSIYDIMKLNYLEELKEKYPKTDIPDKK